MLWWESQRPIPLRYLDDKLHLFVEKLNERFVVSIRAISGKYNLK